MSVSPIPAGYHSITPYIFVRGAADAMAFYEKAFGAVEVTRMPGPDGKLMHAEIRIGDSHIMLADEMPEFGNMSPQSLGGISGRLMLYVEDVDSSFSQALAAGATENQPVEDQFWGDRMGTLTDPFGQQWSLATHVEDVPDAEMPARFEAFMRRMAGD